MITPEALDHFHALHGEHSICFNGDFVRMREIIAQAKLAYTLEAQINTAKAEGMEEAARIVDSSDPSDVGFDSLAAAIRAAKEKLQPKEPTV